MKELKNICVVLMTMACGFGLSACSSDNAEGIEREVMEEGRHIVPLRFVGGVCGFDSQDSATRATSSSWNNGDKVYITFYNGTEAVPGEATYSTGSGWSLSFEGKLGNGAGQRCEARYFDNPTMSTSALVTLNPNTAIFEDAEAKYEYANGTVIVQAVMKPKTGRIRFKGTPGERIHTNGITYYTTYSPETNSFASSDAFYQSTVGNDGYTPYIYGYLADEQRRLGLVGSDVAFTRSCAENVLKAGESGYMTIPTETVHDNWRSGIYVNVNGAEFKMMPVAGHDSGFFLMGETEVTERQYKAVKFSQQYNSQKPMNDISVSTIKEFPDNMNTYTGLSFALPTVSQWLYAAKGGKYSLGYKYAGSDIADNVAWYAGNSTSAHDVKTKQPNELGLYDMSGNVDELTLPSKFLGGSYRTTLDKLEPNENNYTEYSYGNYTSGFRLILTF